jgi:hypothetical protein
MQNPSRVGNFHFHFFAWAERAGLQFLHVLRGVHQENIEIGRRFGFQEVLGFGDPAGDQPIASAPVLLGREYVIPDRKIIGVAVDELEREHGAHP